MYKGRGLWCAVALSLVAMSVIAAELPRADPVAVGLSSERLGRIGQVLNAKVDAGEIPGAELPREEMLYLGNSIGGVMCCQPSPFSERRYSTRSCFS